MLRTLTLLLILLSAACSDTGIVTSPAEPASIDVAILVDGVPSPIGIIGHELHLSATVRNRSGEPITGAPVSWTSETPWVATVDQEGRASIMNVGIARVRVSSGSISRLATIEIRIGQDSIRIRPGGALGMLPGASVLLTSVIYRSNGDVGEDDAIQWSTSDPSVAGLATSGSFFTRLLNVGTTPGMAAVRIATSRNVDSVAIAVERPVTATLALSLMGGCMIAENDHRPWCWGQRLSGLFSWFMPTRDFLSPMRPPAPAGVRTLALGWITGCAIADPGALWCWNDNGVLDPTPTRFGEPWRDVAVGTPFEGGITCAISADRRLWCWGDRQGGRFTGPGFDPVPQVIRPDLSFRSIESGHSLEGGHLCAITIDDALWCWGQNPRGEVGVPPVAEVPAMRRVEGLPPVQSVSVGGEHTCAIDLEDGLWCWGDNTWGQLGRPGGDGMVSHVPTRLTRLPAVGMVAAGGFHTCALDRTGGVWCWGRNEHGQLGVGDRVDRADPTRIEPRTTFRLVRSAGTESCALVVGSGVACWGRAYQGYSDHLLPRAGNPGITAAP